MAKKNDDDITKVFEGLDALNPYGSILKNSALSVVCDWTDTGSYALNAICSGSLYKGIPNGRFIGLCGPSGCGKTVMATKMLAFHMKKDKRNWGVVFDSEMAYDADTASRLGCDPSKIKHYPVNTVLEVRNQLKKLLDNIIKLGLEERIFIIIDSLGNLASDKELSDADKDSFAADMGLRAKDIKGLFRVCTVPAARAKATVVFTNHTYKNPTELYPSAVQNQSGGEGPIYLASLVIQLGFKRQKNEKKPGQIDYSNEEILSIAKDVGGIQMHALTTKNRFIPHMLMTDIYLNFLSGLDKYSGLFELAKGLNVITGANTFEFEGEKLGFRNQFARDPEVWKRIMPALETAINKKFSFHSEVENFAKLVDEIENDDIMSDEIENDDIMNDDIINDDML
jgi:RecA/RadA recombinase